MSNETAMHEERPASGGHKPPEQSSPYGKGALALPALTQGAYALRSPFSSSVTTSVALVALIVVAGVVHGLWTNRWGETAELKTAISRLDAIPRSLPGWQGVDRKLNPEQIKGIAGGFYHRYVQASSGKAVEIFILCDRPGVVAVHTPDVCYTASGYKMGEKHSYRVETGAGPEEFITAVFKKENGGEATYLRIFWTWTNTGPWVAPDEPRLAFATSKMLYKMYVIQELTAPDEPYENGPTVELLRQLLPSMRTALFPPNGVGAASRAAPQASLLENVFGKRDPWSGSARRACSESAASRAAPNRL